MSHNLISSATFSRATSARYIDGDLVIQLAGSNVPRDTNFVDLGNKNLLLEDARTNLLLRSEELDNGSWTQGQLNTVTANATTAPDGNVTADEIIEDGTASVQHQLTQAVTITASASVALTWYVKANTRTWVFLELINGARIIRQWFNLSTGALGSNTTAGGATFGSAKIKQASNGFYRLHLVGTIGGGLTSVTCSLSLSTGDTTVTYNGDNSSSVYAFGAQLEDNVSFASSYIPTTDATVARAADEISFPFSLAPQAMTIYLRFVELGTIDINLARLFHIGKSDDSDARLYIGESAGDYAVVHDAGASSVNSAITPSPVIDDITELRAVFSGDGAVQLHQSINGAAETSGTKSSANTPATLWSDQLLWLNGVGSTNKGFVGFQSVKVARGEQSLSFMRDFGTVEFRTLVS